MGRYITLWNTVLSLTKWCVYSALCLSVKNQQDIVTTNHLGTSVINSPMSPPSLTKWCIYSALCLSVKISRTLSKLTICITLGTRITQPSVPSLPDYMVCIFRPVPICKNQQGIVTTNHLKTLGTSVINSPVSPPSLTKWCVYSALCLSVKISRTLSKPTIWGLV